MVFQMKAFTLLMTIGLMTLLFSELLMVEGSTCLKSCDGDAGAMCLPVCRFFEKTSTGICTDSSSCPPDKPKECKCV